MAVTTDIFLQVDNLLNIVKTPKINEKIVVY